MEKSHNHGHPDNDNVTYLCKSLQRFAVNGNSMKDHDLQSQLNDQIQYRAIALYIYYKSREVGIIHKLCVTLEQHGIYTESFGDGLQ